MKKIVAIALGGAAGALARAWLSGAAHAVMGHAFPWGTASVNILGSFLFGLVWVLSDERMIIPPQVRAAALVGFMGAFTTFSTFIYESSALITHAQMLTLGANIVGQIVVGLAALRIGMALGRIL